jgi:hypothetical protein
MMLTENPTEKSPKSPIVAGVLDPHSPIELASEGGSTINDPSGKDTKPPFTSGYALPV